MLTINVRGWRKETYRWALNMQTLQTAELTKVYDLPPKKVKLWAEENYF